jgi:amino acid adenylation domain-containing protein
MQYWRQQLGETLPAIDLPTDRPRPQVASYRGASHEFELSPEVSDGLRELSRANGVTVYMTLLATWQILLGRYCAQDELIIGTVSANRTRAELESVIGLIVNTLPIKGDLAGDPTFREFLGRVRSAALGAYKHQDLPYEMLVAELAAGRDVGRRPIIELMFVMEQGLAGRVELNGLTVSEEKISTAMAKYDLMIALEEKGARFEGRIEYNADLFDEPKIRRIAESYQKLAGEIVAGPDRRIWDLPVLTEFEQRTLLSEWNETSVEYAGYEKVHQMFERQVERTPDAIALVCEGAYITYRELNYEASRLAHYLRGLGVGPEVLVGLCVKRSLEMAVGVLAILKAGGAYLPLDPAYPKDRLTFMLEDAKLSVLLTQKPLHNRLPETGATVVYIDHDRELFKEQCRENPADLASDDNLVYVMYTSGSTGRPKGVSLSHRSLSNLTRWHTSSFVSKSRTLQFASPSFDVSFYEMFATWVAGGTLFIAPDELRLDVPGLAAFLSDNRIEKVILPVVVLQQLAEEHSFRKQPLMSLREVITTGEQLQITRPVVKFFNAFSHCSLHNHYGPSESHVVTSYSLTGPPNSWPAYPAIGKPVANSQMYLLDQRLNPVPLGTMGELCIGGVPLARGYLNRPDLTAERFIPDQFSQQPGRRLYKTGDLVRYLEDGNIVFLGRADHQVKIRGFRVELGEVESVLDQHPAVREAVVVTREDIPGNKRLVVYAAAERGQKVAPDDLSAYLRERLPDHMVPSAYVIMEKLPLTANGKVDRAALASTYGPAIAQAEELIPARTPAEELVARVWREALGVERLGINSNFFRLGGHSLLATRIILRLREVFCIEVPVRIMFENPTISGVVKEMATIWGGREIVEEIAWTFLQVEQMSDQDAGQVLAQRSLRLRTAQQPYVPDSQQG